VLKELGPQAAKVQVLFVTIDPERDTQELLAQYVPAFNPTFIGLRGDAAATAKVAKEFKVFYAKSPGTTPDAYSMDHTAGSYVFDTQGKIRLFVRHGKGAAPIAQDIKLLLN
jgi:protein SCO1/2